MSLAFTGNIVGKKQSEKDRLSREKSLKWLKWGVWIYLLLLIFEGALRKWLLPGLSEVLLIVRDPVAIVMILFAWQRNMFPQVTYVVVMFIIGFVAIFTSLFLGHGNLFVSLYGARILLIHFPLIFLIGSVLEKEDVIKMGKAIVWISIPMAVLIALQFYSPQSSLVNRGVGGSLAGAGFSGAMGYFRPSGTFSFTNGTTLFFSMAASFIFYFWLKRGIMSKIILIGATLGLISAIPLSISRSLTLSVAVILFFVFIIASRNPKFLGQMIIGGLSILIGIRILGETSFFSTASEVLLTRFESASRVEGGLEGTILERYFGGMWKAVVTSIDLPFFGQGIGMGTNAGSALLSGGRTFLISEGEWGRLIGEMGALMGLIVIAIRLLISCKLLLESFRVMQLGEILPWMLLSFALLVFPQGQWAQPTTLGFSTLIVGLLIASFNKSDAYE